MVVFDPRISRTISLGRSQTDETMEWTFQRNGIALMDNEYAASPQEDSTVLRASGRHCQIRKGRSRSHAQGTL